MHDFLVALLSGNRRECSQIAKKYLENEYSIKSLYENIFKTSLYQIGKLWEFNKIGVATEHMATSIISSILNEFFSKIISNNRLEKKMIAACVENELHEVGIKMVADVFEMNGYDSFLLGANTPVKELISFVQSIKPDVLALSLSVFFNFPKLVTMIKEIQSAFPKIDILVGGQAFLHGGLEVLEKYPNTKYLPDLNSIDLWIKDNNKKGV